MILLNTTTVPVRLAVANRPCDFYDIRLIMLISIRCTYVQPYTTNQSRDLYIYYNNISLKRF